MEQLAARGITVVEGEVAAVEVTTDRLSGVHLQSASSGVIAAAAINADLTFEHTAGAAAASRSKTSTT